jgi:hypothetical protein
MSKIFNVAVIKLAGKGTLHNISIRQIDAALEAYIDSSIVEICEGNSGGDLAVVKERLIKFLTPKSGSTTEMGAIAEFFSHLYLKEQGFKQEFLFLNLEEQSIKKGFDGYYTLSGVEWIFESKSGSINTDGNSHPKKIQGAC